MLAAFILWEQHVRRDLGREPLVDLALFHSAGFTWGTILATIVSFAMFGLLFTVPQYFQLVRGTDAMGAGIRLLPLIGGLIIGGVLADRLTRKAGVRITVALGFVLIAVGLMVGATTGIDSSDAFSITWVAVIGAGLGFALPPAMDGALGALSAERSGVGSALIQAMRQVGGIFGVAVLGSILNAAYRSHLNLEGLPAPAADAVRRSAAAGVAVARQLASAPLLQSVRDAFVHGMDVMLWVCGGIAAVGIVLALAFLPRQTGTVEQTEAERVESRHEMVV
jgi:Na+/melibiose symporter-like transporter